MAEANIKAVITADDKASATLRRFGDTADSIGHSIAKTAKIAAIGIAAAGAAATAFGVAAVKAYSEAEDSIEQTRAVLKSTGGAAGVTMKQVTDLATSLQKVTKFSDEEIRSGQNLLLTFTKIGKDIFPQATETILNMSTALGQDLKSSAVQLGKALQDPVLGITALRRVGVNFSDDQKKVIEDLVATGRAAEAQKIILQELQVEFGGSARAAGTTFAGKLAILKNSLNDVQETIGFVIVDALQPFAVQLADIITKIDWEAVIDRSINSLKKLYYGFIELYQAIFNYVAPGITRFLQVVQQVWHWLYNMLAPSVQALGKAFMERLWPQIKQLWEQLEPGFTKLLQGLGILLGATLVGAIWLLINVLNVLSGVLGFVINVVGQSIQWFGNFVGMIVNAAREVGGFVSQAIAWFNRLPPGIRDALIGVASTIIAPFKDAFRMIASLWNNTVGKISFKIPDWVPGVGGKGFDVPDIPMLAQGGIVTKPTLAMIGEAGPEAVVPLNKTNTMQPNIVVNIGMYAGTDIEKRKIAKELMRAYQDAMGYAA